MLNQKSTVTGASAVKDAIKGPKGTAKGKGDAVTSKIVEYMRAHISSGEWPVGSMIPSENQLRLRLDVSRTSLRSAIMQLSALNILKARQGIGTFVIAPLHDDAIFEDVGTSLAVKREIVQILEFLKIMAPTAIFLEMKKFSKSFMGIKKSLENSLVDQKALAHQDQASFLQCCFDFHTTIFSTITNEFIRNSILEAIDRLKSSVVTLQPSISGQVIITLHTKLLQALIEENAKRARRILKKMYTYLTAHDYLRSLT